MDYKKLKKILLKYYKLNTVKRILAPRILAPISFKMALKMLENDGIPLEAWSDIRAWADKQETGKK